MNSLEVLKNRCIAGGNASYEEALYLIEKAPKEELYEAAHQITLNRTSMVFDTCSIINARSGRCSEDCKWCAQSAHYKTDVEVYPLVDNETCLKQALENQKRGINRYGIVTSGRGQSNEDIEKLCSMIAHLRQNSSIHICASLGLVTKSQLARLKEAGLERLHCNLEAAPQMFEKLCTTHTTAMKMATIKAAQELGIEVCSGGILGMGETPRQRVELFFAIKEAGIKSFPLNILNPIAGTPLEGTAPMSDDDILSAVATLRFIVPDIFIRFAGGRAKRSKELIKRSFYVGVNSCLMGDMLTTPGTDIADEFNFIKEAGYK